MSAASTPAKEGRKILTQLATREKREYFHWVIEDYSLLREDPLNRYYSPVVCLGGQTWRILLFPNGNKSHHYVSAYLEVAEQHLLPTGWTREATFQLTSPLSTSDKAVRHWFDSQRSDWGFTEFIQRHLPVDSRTKDDIITIEVWVETHVQDVKIIPPIDQHFPGATKTLKDSGYAGLQSFGQGQYLNSVIMMLFHLGSFRSSVYALDTRADPTNQTTRIALQRMFYHLQRAEKSGVNQSSLVDTLGWPTFDSWDEAHNVARSLPHLFASVFGDAQLPGFLHLPFDVLDQQANLAVHGAHALQVALSSVEAPDAPPAVLCVSLNRFTHDGIGCKHKVTAAFGYTPTVEFCGVVYQLHAALVHNGHPHGGHYHSFIRPTAEPRWFKFDDELVVATRDDVEVYDDNFGGPRTTSHAYVLLYVNVEGVEQGTVIAPLDHTPIGEELQIRFAAEDDADHRNYLQQREHLLFMDVRVATPGDLHAHNQSATGLVDFETVTTLRIKKNTWFCDFKRMAEQLFHVPVTSQRWWSWAARENGTFRPESVITGNHNDEVDMCKLTHSSDWCVSLENTAETTTIRNDPRDMTSNLYVFLKYYDPAAPEEPIRFLGGVLLDRYQPLSLLRNHCAAIAKVPSTELLLFEEVNPHLIEQLDPSQTFNEAAIQYGDIIIFQRVPVASAAAPSSSTPRRPPFCPDWYRHLAERVTVDFVFLPASPHPQQQPLRLQLNYSDSYNVVAASLATALSARAGASPVLPDHIRITGHNPLLNEPRMLPHLPSHDLNLKDMLVYQFGAVTPLLYFEVLPPHNAMSEYQRNRSLVVEWAPSGTRHEVLVPKSATVFEALEVLKQRCPAAQSTPTASIRLFSIHPVTKEAQATPILHESIVGNVDMFRSYRASPAH